MTISRREIVATVASRSRLTKKEADAAITNFLDEVMAQVADGEKITFTGFGSFEPQVYSGRKGRNPATGEEISIAATRRPRFRAGKTFLEKVSHA